MGRYSIEWGIMSRPRLASLTLVWAAGLALAVLALSATSGERPESAALAAGAPNGGLRFAVFLGPICDGPAGVRSGRCRIDFRPLNAALRVRPAAGGDARTVRSGRDGRTRIRLVPGDYEVEPLQARPSPIPPRRFTVTVPETGYLDVIVDYPTGRG